MKEKTENQDHSKRALDRDNTREKASRNLWNPRELRGCLARIKGILPSLFPAEQRVAEFILNNPEAIIHLSITEVAEESEVSESTVVRFCQNLGYSGYHELKITLARDLVTPVHQIHQDIEQGDSIVQVIDKVFRADIQALYDTERIIDPEEMERAVEAISSCRRIELFAVGNSLPIALDAEYRFIRIGLPCIVYRDAGTQAMSASLMRKRDVGLGISHSGSSKDTVEAMRLAHEAGATTICITNYSKSPIIQVSDIKLFTTSRETTFRDEAMASRIAQLAIVDALFVGVALRRFEKALDSIKRTGQVLPDRKY
jgi:RpiR family carbohydrate utilization transcriptional regulator